MMSPNFDPYRQWLGIEVDSPNYFELLGLSPDHHDSEMIQRAANQQISKIRSIRPGKQAQLWTRLIDEIKEAEECLSDAALRKAYLAGVRSIQASSESPVIAATLTDDATDSVPMAILENNDESIIVEELISESPPAAAPVFSESIKPSNNVVSIDVKRKRKKSSWKIMAIGHVIIAVSMLGLAYFLFVYDGSNKANSGGRTDNVSGSQQSDGALPESKLSKQSSFGKKNPVDKSNQKNSSKDDSVQNKNNNANPIQGGQSLADNDKQQGKSKTPDENGVVQQKNLSPTFRYLLVKKMRNLHYRQFNAAREAEAKLRKLELNQAEKKVLDRYDVAMLALKNFWESVGARADKIPAGTEIVVAGRTEPLAIVEASKERIVFRYAGGNRRYFTNLIPNLIAEALLARELGVQSTNYNLRVNVFRALHEFQKPGSLKSAIREFRKLTDQTEDAAIIIEFFEKDWPKVLGSEVVETLPKQELVNLKKSLASKFRLRKKQPVSFQFIQEALDSQDTKAELAMFASAAEYDSKAGRVDCLDAAQWLHNRTQKFDLGQIVQMTKDFPKKKGESWDAFFFVQRILGILDDSKYGWSKSQKQTVLKEIFAIAKGYKFENLTRVITNRAKSLN